MAVLTISGALGALLSDKLVKNEADLPTLPDDVQKVLRTGIPTFGMVANPVDLTGNIVNDHAFFGRTWAALQQSDAVDMVLLYAPGYLLDKLAPTLIESASASSKLVAAIDTQEAKTRGQLEEAGVPVFGDVSRGVMALTAFASWSQHNLNGFSHQETPPQVNSAALAMVEQAISQGQSSLNEVDAKRLVACYGATSTPEQAAAAEEAAVAAANSIGYPVVVKILSADILHKSDLGGVKLNLNTEDEVWTAFQQVVSSARSAMPSAAIDGVVVQKQASAGVEILAGITQDSVFGATLTVGLGGIFTEILKDVQLKSLPVGPDDVPAMLRRLKGYPLLTGVRGKPACDIDAICSTVAALGNVCLAHPEISELEVNPLVARPGHPGVTLLDCLVTFRSKDGSTAGLAAYHGSEVAE